MGVFNYLAVDALRWDLTSLATSETSVMERLIRKEYSPRPHISNDTGLPASECGDAEKKPHDCAVSLRG